MIEMRKRWRRGIGEGPSLGVSGLYPLLVLLMIHKGAFHGYEIKRRIEDLTGTPMPAGFIYVTLDRLESYGLVVSSPLLGDPRRKKIYRLTPLGLQTLVSRINELKVLKSIIERILNLYEG